MLLKAEKLKKMQDVLKRLKHFGKGLCPSVNKYRSLKIKHQKHRCDRKKRIFYLSKKNSAPTVKNFSERNQ